MSVYKISATKYRPNTFMDVVGQDAVTSTLQNAIKQNKLGQALLFCGPRGVGKTTCARILAKKINLNEGKNIDDFSFNIFELDAASNRSVDDIRSLNEQVRVPPRIGNFKVYIIDEVHMLTTEAFNAFLKTLEEPPEHVIFILATTEKSKILPTILSRCQIYDFRRISVLDIKKRIEAILIEEKIKFDDESLYLIAECSDGSLRDGLQILDRLINFCENDISIKKVSKNLNIIGPEQYIQICDYIIKKNISEALVKFDKIISNGFSEINFIIGLSNHFRNLFLSKNNNTINLLETSEKLKSFHLEQSKKVNLDWIRKALKITNSFEINFKNVDNKRIHTELCLMQVASIEIEEKNISEKKIFI
ncbi:MAG: DNA polymerase III, subunit gamma and tau [Flavobacteriaceae bacterium]|nr:DNA polymerase III, subunit gamma and tau [Flavobacteriaceae bacterium]